MPVAGLFLGIMHRKCLNISLNAYINIGDLFDINSFNDCVYIEFIIIFVSNSHFASNVDIKLINGHKIYGLSD